MIAVASIGSLGTWAAVGRLAGKRAVEHAYTVETKVTVFENGEVSGETGNVYAVREDGARVALRSYRRSDGSPMEVRSVSNPNLRVRHVMNSRIESITSLPLSKDAAEVMRQRLLYCGNDPKAATSEVLGFKVVRQVVTPGEAMGEGAAAAPVAERWLAPRLGCATLRAKISRDGEVTSIEEAVYVRLGEPDPKLFEIPSDYQEMSPADTFSHLSERFNIAEPEAQLVKTLEDGYQERRAEANWSPGDSRPKP